MTCRSRVCRKSLGAAVAAAVMLVAPGAASADAVLDWNVISERALFVVAGQQPQAAGLEGAMVQGAVYDAVNAIERTHEPYLVAPPAKRGDSKDAAAATAAYRVLVGVVPEQQASLQVLYEESLAAIPDGAAKVSGIAVGEQAAAAMLAARENDGRDAAVPAPVFGAAPGQWRPTPPALLAPATPWLGAVTPFVIPSAQQFRSNGPRNLAGANYAQDFNEVKAVGSRSSTTRTPDQTDAAVFWHLPPWGQVARSIAVSRELDTAENARLLAMMTFAAADGAIACFTDKYYWKFWRPVTAIHEAASDGNPATAPDPNWTPLLDTPNHPEHPSGHACASGAIASTLKHFFHTDEVAFSAYSPLSNTTRSFSRLSQALEEIEGARVWAGVHFRTADVLGERLGRQVAHWLRDHYFHRWR
jgi:PAP2 superfamily